MKKIHSKNVLNTLFLVILCLVGVLAAGCGIKSDRITGEIGTSAGQEIQIEEQSADKAEIRIEEQNADKAEIRIEEQSTDNTEIRTEEQSTDNAEIGVEEQDADDADISDMDISDTEEPDSEEPDTALDPAGTYTSKEDVALYIHLYGRLPSNFITKNEAQALGWSGGSLEEYAPGKCIGGSRFGNYEGILPEGHNYKECDIDTLGQKSRGAKRIVYSDDGLIYYTQDHYGSFELLYGEE